MKKLFLLLFVINTVNGFAQPDKALQIREVLSREEANGYSGSVLVAGKGKILFEGGIGFADRESKRKQTAETVFSIGSITKQFTAAAILKLEANGKLGLNDPLSKYFQDAPADKKNITLII